ncbi:MAG: hypothetical protein JWM37_310 [Candidatus Saccharibacteria bacterium]|nr:hypothetical protein [Candidatus Saccharibacteria bacterium]
MYKSTFIPSSGAESVLRQGNIISNDESAANMIERVVQTAFAAEEQFGTPQHVSGKLAQEFGEMCDKGEVVMSTPVLTNAGRYAEKPLTACTMPPVDLRGDLKNVKSMIDTLHQQGMGTGFNLGDTEDPVSMLDYLNRVAVTGSESGMEDRPVGNMAIIPVRHPKIREFIDAKRESARDGSTWKFNISVDVDDEFMGAVGSDGVIDLDDGSKVKASSIFNQIGEAAHMSADPGLIFLNRMNDRNPTPGIGLYQTTAPCAEVGLAPGETCQFGYINLGKFLKQNGDKFTIDYDKLATTSRMMTRVLDNCLELSLQNYTTPKSTHIMRLKRKIGVGICGVADLLVKMGVSYSSEEAVQSVQNAIAWVNYNSKLASINLAEERGSCGAMNLLNISDENPMNRHTAERPLLDKLFSEIDTEMVSGDDWSRLAQVIKSSRHLRNVTTTALPPTGRSSLVIDASTGIEPHFSFTNSVGELIAPVADHLEMQGIAADRFNGIKSGRIIPTKHEAAVLEVCENATAISVVNHLNMAAGVQKVIDEAVSKTVNMPSDTTPSDVQNIYYKAWQDGMSGITIYREGTHSLQPLKLGDSK